MKNSIQRLNLEGTYNTRELGGYPCEKGQQMTRYGQFLRSGPFRRSDCKRH